jgi:hypothetical protein
MDKSDEEIIASFSQNKMTVFTWKDEKDTTMTLSIPSLLQVLPAGINGYGTANQEYQSLGWRYQLQILNTTT